MRSSHTSSAGELAVKLWIAIGAITFVCLVVLSFVFDAVRAKEYQRFIECANKTRVNCRPSALWLMGGWRYSYESDTSSGSPTTTVAKQPTYPHSERSSDSAPQIYSAKEEGMTYDSQGGYFAFVGTHVTTTVQVADATTVEVYYRSLVSAVGSPVRLVKLTRKQGGVYVGTWIVPTDFIGELEFRVGELEFRASNEKGETASLYWGLVISNQ